MQTNQTSNHIWLLLLVIGWLCLGLWQLTLGSQDISSWQVLQVLTGAQLPESVVVVELRLPRAVMLLIGGGALALAGYLMQLLMDNPLADPYLTGTASGAVLGANLGWMGILPLYLGVLYLPPVYAFIGAAITTVAVLSITHALLPRRLAGTSYTWLLVGVAMAQFLGGFNTFITYLVPEEMRMRANLIWLMGNFDRATYGACLWVGSAILIAIVWLFLRAKALLMLAQGPTITVALGTNLKRIQAETLAITSLLTASVLAQVGAIGFVGLIVPHVVRRFTGYSGFMPFAMTLGLGGIVVTLADGLGRWLFPPTGLPTGIITAMLGGPFFVYLLLRNKRV